MGMLRMMSRRGDNRVKWDQSQVEAKDPEALAAVAEAERIFAQERARGATAFEVASGQPPQVIKAFDQEAPQIFLVPRVTGG